MLIQPKRVDQVLGVHLHKVYNTARTDATTKLQRSDFIAISKLSQLVERGRAKALLLPAVREDLVAEKREALLSGKQPESKQIAAEIIKSALGMSE
ncbi:MAG: hypothetical protein QHI38_11550 [Armatimonadota bacterium]|nr:hypothetical protein [Armatimonadota bacterium]